MGFEPSVFCPLNVAHFKNSTKNHLASYFRRKAERHSSLARVITILPRAASCWQGIRGLHEKQNDGGLSSQRAWHARFNLLMNETQRYWFPHSDSNHVQLDESGATDHHTTQLATKNLLRRMKGSCDPQLYRDAIAYAALLFQPFLTRVICRGCMISWSTPANQEDSANIMLGQTCCRAFFVETPTFTIQTSHFMTLYTDWAEVYFTVVGSSPFY